MAEPREFALDMDAEVATRKAQPAQQQQGLTAQQFADQFEQLTREAGVADANPLAVEKIQRDLEYQRQMENLPQPDSAPPLPPDSTPALDRLDQLQKEVDAAKQEAAKFKRLYGQKTGDVGVLRRELSELQGRVNMIQPTVNVRQITGKEADEPLTAGDVVNLLISQSQAFGNGMRQMRDELLQQGFGTPQSDGLPLDMEAELVESHPWLTDLPRQQKLRAMHDILASAGVSVAPPAASTPAQVPPRTAALPNAAKAPVRQAAFIEPSNRGSVAERDAIAPERSAFNEKVAKLKEILTGPYKPGVSDKAAELLASLGAGPVDETQMGVFSNMRR